MSKTKSEISVFGIVLRGLKTYLYNLDTFLKYLAFPVLGMIFGAFLLFLINYFYVINLDNLQKMNAIFSNVAVVLTAILILTLPGFLIFIKAFVDYIVAYGALNSMCVNEKRIVDVNSHTEIIKRRFIPYCWLIILLSLIFLLCIVPPLIIFALIFLSLSVQIFVLEENSTPFDAIKKSCLIVKNNFWAVFWILIIITVISYGFIPYLISWAVAKTPVFGYLTYPVERYISLLPINDINEIFNELNISYTFDVILIAENIVNSVISTIVIMFMLPFRCACCVEIYKASGSDFYNSSKEIPEKSKEKSKKGRNK